MIEQNAEPLFLFLVLVALLVVVGSVFRGCADTRRRTDTKKPQLPHSPTPSVSVGVIRTSEGPLFLRMAHDRREQKPFAKGQGLPESDRETGRTLSTSDHEDIYSDKDENAEWSVDDGVNVRTLIGVVRFKNSHAIGRFGDWLTHKRFNTGDPKARYRQSKSKISAVHGIDAVYTRNFVESAVTEVLVIENKVNSGKLRVDQLSRGGIESRANKMLMCMDAEVRKTGEMLVAALHDSQRFCMFRVLYKYSLVKGTRTLIPVDEDGGVIDGEARVEEIGATIKDLLYQKIRKGEARLMSELDGNSGSCTELMGSPTP